MSPRFLLATASVALLASIPGTGAAGGTALHDYDAATLASYVSLRFSSAVPPNVIRQVLAGEGFSQADLNLVTTSNASVGRPSSNVGPPGVSSVQQISKDTLACPSSDPTPCELDTETEPDIAVNPLASGNLVAVFQQGRFSNGGAVDTGWAASFDGGKTWPYKGSLPGLTVGVSPRPTPGPGVPFARASDPVVAYDSKHKNVLANDVAVSDSGCVVFCDSAVTVNISSNQAQTFGPPIVLNEDVSDPNKTPLLFNDKNWITTDNTPTSPFYGRTYAVWDQVRCADVNCAVTSEPVVLRTSDDGGKTWSGLIQATDEQPGTLHSEIGVQPLVLPNGHVVIVFGDVQAGAFTFLGSYQAIRSSDGGRTWSQPVLITVADPFLEESAGLRAPNLPMAAVDGGTIYVAFQDERSGAGRNDILLTSSTNEGQSWSLPVNATPGELGLDHFTPALAATGGKVQLTYRTRLPGSVNTPPASLVDAVYRAVRGSDGVTTSGPFVLATSDAGAAAFTTVAGVPLKFFGDYAGIAASSISAHPVWDQSQTFSDQQANPTNTHQRSFSARIQ